MPFVNVWEPQGICTRFHGHVSAADYVRSAEEICADPRFDALRFVIKDLLGIPGHSIGHEVVDDIAAIRCGARYSNPNIRLVILSTDPALVSLAHPEAGSSLRGLYPCRAFADEPSARRWLAAEPPLTQLAPALKV